MSYLLDTDTCSFHLRNQDRLTTRFVQYSGRISLPTIVVGELYAWAYCAPNSVKLLSMVERLIGDFSILLFDLKCAAQFGELRGTLRKNGLGVPTADLMIASVALVHDLTLVTHNAKDYRLIPNLRLEDWVAA
ncbi:MAG TPA: type II toxin-antitoxin system VapC family toxin [Pirellulales bacterium]